MTNARLVVAILLAWVVALTAGSWLVWRYKVTPAGPHADAPALWPTRTTLPRLPDKATLLVFAHPRCPCTSATIAEVARAMALAENQNVNVVVRFFVPKDAGREWLESSTWAAARLLPRSDVDVDEEGREASSFAASASGTVLVYDRSARLVFAGGVTTARGHEGDSAARRALVAALDGRRRIFDLPIFGCRIRGSDA